jgi:DNA-binding transcriptional LysR family regulator
MELHQLRCTVAVADYGSFTAAAAALYLSQPALSYAVGRLEHELGVELFLRLPRKIVLTAAGEAILLIARQTLARAEDVRTAATAVSGAMAGRLRLAAQSPTPWLTSQLARFHNAHPRVVLTIYNINDAREAINLVRAGQVELSLALLGSVKTDLAATEVVSDDVVCILPADLHRPDGPISLSELSAHGLIAPLAGTRSRQLYDDMFLEAGVTPNVVAEYQDLAWAIEMVRAGLGCTVSQGGRIDRVRDDGLRILWPTPSIRRSMFLIHQPEHLSAAASAFVEMVTPAER